jgi:hypothetical protein
VFDLVKEAKWATTELGRQPLTELVFCVKRLPGEATPPVVFTLKLSGATTAATDSKQGTI